MPSLSDNEVVSVPLADRLCAAGVRDVKFFFQPDVGGRPLSETKASVNVVLESYLAKKYEPMGKIGDSCLTAN